MDPTAGLKACAKCGEGIWAENPSFPLCEKCASQQIKPTLLVSAETVEDTAKTPAVKRPRGERAADKREKD